MPRAYTTAGRGAPAVDRGDRVYRRVVSGVGRGALLSMLLVAACGGVSNSRSASGCVRDDHDSTPTTIVAFDAISGVVRWEHRLRAGVSAIAVGGTTVAAATNAGQVIGFEPASGTLRWCADIGADAHSAQVPMTPAVVAVGDVLVASDDERGLVGLDPATGAVRWERPELLAGRGLTFIAAEDVIVVRNETTIAAVEPGTGTDRWRRGRPGCPIASTTAPEASSAVATPVTTPACATSVPNNGLVAAGNNVVISAAGDGPLVALNLADGSQLWEQPAPLLAVGGDEHVAVATATQPTADDNLVVVDATTGTRRWSTRTGFSAGVAGDVAIGFTQVLDTTPQRTQLDAYDLTTGALRWTRQIEGLPQRLYPLDYALAVADGETVTVVEAPSGLVRWSVTHPTPAADGDHNQPGVYSPIVDGPDEVIAAISANRPYHD
jgi:outer membrane protein assembly factor BamB